MLPVSVCVAPAKLRERTLSQIEAPPRIYERAASGNH